MRRPLIIHVVLIIKIYLDCNKLSGTVLGRSVFLEEVDMGLSLARETGRDVFDGGLDLAFDFLDAGRELVFLCPNGSSAPILSILLRYFFSPSLSSLKKFNDLIQNSV